MRHLLLLALGLLLPLWAVCTRTDALAKITDPAFGDYLLRNFDTDKDGRLSVEEAAAVTKIAVSQANITSLEGIEAFVNLTELDCSVNQLTTLTLHANTALQELNCSGNQLTTLDVSANTALMYLSCYGNQLATLGLGNNTVLGTLYCYNNRLTALDVSANIGLVYLVCGTNRLAHLEVSHNTALSYLECNSNQLSILDVTHNTALATLWCGDNRLTSLDVHHNPALAILHCYGNRLTTLDVSGNPHLTHLNCWNNQIDSLDVSHNTALQHLHCDHNALSWSNLYTLGQQVGMSNGYLGAQTVDAVVVKTGQPHPLDAVFDGSGTGITVHKNGAAATLNTDYTLSGSHITFTQPGTYQVTLANSGIASDVSRPAQLLATYMVKNQPQPSTGALVPGTHLLPVYPNPTTGIVRVQWPANHDTPLGTSPYLQVCTLGGQWIMDSPTSNQADLSSLPAGVYVIRCGAYAARVVKR